MPDTRGRRRTPADIRLVKGAKTGKASKAAAELEPKPPPGVPPMPEGVKADPVQTAKWHELVHLTTLPDAYTLTLADGPMLELACRAWSQALLAATAGHWNRAEKCERAYERRLCHFGLSPAMRSKVERVPEKPADDKAEAHFQ